MNTETRKNTFHFIKNGGEMGELTRNFNWSETSVGSPETWPQSLRLTLSMILSSKFPMFLWWGEELIQFYNDAYRPSLGNNGKHPLALGQKGRDCWPEIWHIIHPLIEQVRTTGEATWSENQLIPIYRNGELEDVYWTFGYSPILGDDEKIEGVLVVCTETTETIKARRATEESEQRFKKMAEGTEILIATSDETSNATYFNKTWTEFTGKSMNELINFGWTDLIHPEDRQRFLDIYLTAFKKRESWIGEFRMLNKDGQYRWLLSKGPVRLHNDGSFAGYISSSLDITERIEVEKALKKSEQEISSLIQSAPFPIGVYKGREMRVELANQSILKIWGKGNNVFGKLFSEILPELDNQEVFKQLDQVFTTGTPMHIKNQPLDLVVDGKIKQYYFNYSFTPLFDENGNVYGVMNTGADVTELNVAKRKVEENEQSLRNTILQAPVAMCIFKGPQHVVEIANDRMVALWGKEKKQVLHKPIFEGLPEAKEQGFEELLEGVYTTGKTFVAEGVPITLPRNGKIENVFVNFVYEAYREPDHTISGILAVAVDVTSQVIAHRKIEEVVTDRTRELAESNTNLQRSNMELAQFAYIASHDLQEPLRKIGTFSQMLEHSLGDKIEDHSKRYLDKINNSASRMNTLIRDVLAYSELIKESELFKKTDLNEVIETIKGDYDLLIEQRDASVIISDLPVLEAIPLQMSQLFGNLLGNALKFIKKDVKPIITIHSSKLSSQEKQNTALDQSLDYYKIQFTDNGIGFQPQYAEQIFNIFQRLHRKSEFEGTGIGLAMCKKIVLNHRGSINATGSSEKGAVFNIILPVRQDKSGSS